MAASKEEIVNLGLVYIGEKRITTLSDEKETSNMLNAVYDISRRRLLSMYNWTFAIDTVELAQEGSPLTKWTYRYRLPVDFISVVSVNDTVASSRQTHFYEVKGQHIYSDEESLYLEYVKDETNTGLFTPSFVEAFARDIGYSIAYGRTNSQPLADAMRQARDEAIAEAKAYDSQQSQKYLPDYTKYPSLNARTQPWRLS